MSKSFSNFVNNNGMLFFVLFCCVIVMSVGIVLNFLAIKSNNGIMPIRDINEEGKQVYYFNESKVNNPILTDILYIPHILYFSIGDLLYFVGSFTAFGYTIRVWKVKYNWRLK
jgi:hypothetical protein